jgi:hypothetical protein
MNQWVIVKGQRTCSDAQAPVCCGGAFGSSERSGIVFIAAPSAARPGLRGPPMFAIPTARPFG